MSSASALSDAELHGLVDGCLAVERRADALRRAAASTLDRTRIGAWQDQNELIRAAFADVAFEPLPASLDLRTPPRLHCVAEPAPTRPDPAGSSLGRRGIAAVLATIVLIGGGLLGSWMLFASEPATPRVSSVEPRSSQASDGDDLAAQLAAALEPAVTGSSGATLPTATIPDLTPVGFTFTGADATHDRMDAVMFRYRNPDAERVVIGAVRAARTAVGGDTSVPIRIGRTYAWRVGDAAFAITGTLPDARLRAIALSLSVRPGDR